MIFLKRRDSHARLIILAIGAFLSVDFICQANTIFNLSLDTSGLVGNANDPFALDFQFSSGDTTSGVSNTATLSLFAFGAGGSAGVGNPFPNSGNASGDVGSTVVLNTSGGSFFNEFSQNIAPGSMLSFQINLTNNPQSSGTPDEFTFQLIDNTLSGISTTDPSGSSSLVIIDLTGGTLTPRIFSTNGDSVAITPHVSLSQTEVPEPASVWLLAPTLLATLWFVRKRVPNTASSPWVGRRIDDRSPSCAD
jgi:hypothetical protein